MSTMMLSQRFHYTLADTLGHILDCGFERFGFEAPESLHKALSDCRNRYGLYDYNAIYLRLYSLNEAAYTERYGSSDCGDIPDKPYTTHLVEPRQWKDGHEILLPWHYTFCKMLDCLIYQIDEDATEDFDLTMALRDFSRMFKSFLVVNTDEYNNAPWGDF